MAKKVENEQYFIGIEATGSRTVALLANADGEILGEGSGPPSVYSIVGQERCERGLWTAIIGAFGGAGYNTRDILKADQPLPQVQAICVGMSGVERPKDEGHIRRLLTKFNLFDQMLVTSDAHIVLEAACLFDMTNAGYGVAVLAGESGLVFGKGPTGKTARAGGWGYLLGDEGSAHHIGLRAVQACLRVADGREKSSVLTSLVEQEWKLPEGRTDKLSQRVYSLLATLGTGGNKAQLEDSVEGYKRSLAMLAPLVERAAANGDSVAGAILDEAAHDLTDAVVAVIHKTGLDELPPPNLPKFKVAGMDFELNPGNNVAMPLAIYGSVLLSNAGQLRQRLQAEIEKRGLRFDSPLAVLNPAEGAVKLAMLAGGDRA